MEKDLAEFILKTAFRSSADLNDLIPLLKQHCSDDEYRIYFDAISRASGEIAVKILNPIFKQYPDIEKEFERKIEEFGRVF